MQYEDEEETSGSFGDMIDRIRQYEEAEKNNRPLFLEEAGFNEIIDFYLDNREFKRALHVADAALEIYPYAVQLWIQKAAVLTEQNKFAEAMEILKHAESLDKSEIPIYLLRADIYLAQSKHVNALDMVEEGLAIAEEMGDICDLYLEQADIYEDMGLYMEVKDALKKVIELDPENEEALSRIWLTVELTEDYADSILLHKKLVDASPYNKLAWFNLGHALAGEKKYAEAEEAMGYAIAIDEEFEAAYVMLGDIRAEQGKYDEALEVFLDAVKLLRPTKETFCKAGECYAQLHAYHKARVYFRKAIAIDPNYDEAHFLVGETYRVEENFEKAVQAFQRAVRISPENLEYLNALGDAYIMNDQVERAVEIFERVILLDQKTKQHYINLATAYYGIEDMGACFNVLNEAVRIFPNESDLYFIQFVFYLQIGNRNEALVCLQKGLLLDWNNHVLIFEMDETIQMDAEVMRMIEQFRVS